MDRHLFEEQVPLLVFFWGDPRPYVPDAHRRGIKVFLQVGSVEEAQIAAAAGVDGIIAQGLEAGGHVKSTTALSTLLPAVVEAVSPVPVIAAGGIADGRGLVAALSLGAQAVSLGRAFYVVRRRSRNRPTRNEWCRARPRTPSIPPSSISAGMLPTESCATRWSPPGKRQGVRLPGSVPGEGMVIGIAPRGETPVALVRYTPSSYPSLGFKGNIEDTVLYAGESVRSDP